MISSATQADAETLAAVHVAAWDETYFPLLGAAALGFRSLDQRVAQWRAWLMPGSGSVAFVARDADGAAVGFAGCGRVREPGLATDSEISPIYLLRRAQGRGVGRGLMRAAARHLMAGGARSAGLRVMDVNLAARGFYKRLGGEEHDDGRSFTFAGRTIRDIAVLWPELSVLAQG